VTVDAAAITFAELTWDLSWTTRDGRDRTPVIPSHEMSGTLAALGPGTSGVTPGDEVYGLIAFDRDGAAAEYVTMPAAEPRSVPHEAAATLPLAALTAWQALVDYAALEAGQRVLVRGGAGGVGVSAVQLAAEQARAHQVHAMFFVVATDAGELAQLAGLVDQGRLRPVVSQTFPLGEGRRAFESRGQPRPPGKTVLAVG
jgi:NADPH:quinone reductase-like Zn-dependent oxidoreductase